MIPRGVIQKRQRAKQRARASKRITRANKAWEIGRWTPQLPKLDDFTLAVGRMTNRQRSAWAKAGYPGLRNKEVEPLWAFVAPEPVKARPTRKRSKK